MINDWKIIVIDLIVCFSPVEILLMCKALSLVGGLCKLVPEFFWHDPVVFSSVILHTSHFIHITNNFSEEC